MLCFVLLSALTGAAHAEQAPEHQLSLTVSPLHTILPMLEVTGEVRAADKLGVAVIGAFGSSSGVPVWEAGAQGRYYVIGDFEQGMQVGAEVLYVGASAGAATASGINAGPFVGYKAIFGSGFTLDGQLGGYYGQLTTHSTTQPNTTSNTFGLLLNANLGWSF